MRGFGVSRLVWHESSGAIGLRFAGLEVIQDAVHVEGEEVDSYRLETVLQDGGVQVGSSTSFQGGITGAGE